MKKKYLIVYLMILGAFMLYANPVKAATSKKVQTNYQYRLVCGNYNGSNTLTWGAQENIGDFTDANGIPSNSNRACGATAATKNFPIGDPNKGNLPKNVTMIYDSCNGATGKQTAKVGTSCSQAGRVSSCSVKWTGYCYKNTTSTSTTKSNAKVKLESNFITVGTTTSIKTPIQCASYKIKNTDIASYNASANTITGIKPGSTYVECYNENGKYVSRKALTVKAKANYRYTTEKVDMYATPTNDFIRSISKCRKVNYLEEKASNGYCKVKFYSKEGYVKCSALAEERPNSCL